jgi:dolichol-phosphate mannosyltransferase
MVGLFGLFGLVIFYAVAMRVKKDMVKGFKVYTVMPAYNEAAHIADVICRIPSIVDKIIVVDDHSSDNTSEVAQATGDSRVEVIRNHKNLGVGGAMLLVYRHALVVGADIVVKIDSDGQMDPQAISKLVKPIVDGDVDYAKGFRFHDQQTLRKMPKVRLVGNMGLSYLVKMASGYWNIFDPTNGFTAIHRGALAMIDLNGVSQDYFFETDMLCKLYRVQAVVKDVLLPTHYGNETSKLSPWKTLVQFPAKLFTAYMRRILWNYYVRDFSTFSILFLVGWLLLLFGVVFGATVWYKNAVKGVVTPTGTVMLAVVPLFLGFQMLLQAVLHDVNNVPKEPLQKGHSDDKWMLNNETEFTTETP